MRHHITGWYSYRGRMVLVWNYNPLCITAKPYKLRRKYTASKAA